LRIDINIEFGTLMLDPLSLEGEETPHPTPVPKRSVRLRVVISSDVLFERRLDDPHCHRSDPTRGRPQLAWIPNAHVLIAGYTYSLPINILGGNRALSLERDIGRSLAGRSRDRRSPDRNLGLWIHAFSCLERNTQGRQANRRAVILVSA
jgi:hypothetical protein